MYLKYLVSKQGKIDKETQIKRKKNVCIYKSNFIRAAFNRAMKNTFLKNFVCVK